MTATLPVWIVLGFFVTFAIFDCYVRVKNVLTLRAFVKQEEAKLVLAEQWLKQQHKSQPIGFVAPHYNDDDIPTKH
jgi:hypothetical protein